MTLLLCLLLQIPPSAPPGGNGQNSADSPATASQIQSLVQQLQNPAYSRRQAATTELLRLPETASPALLDAQTSATGATAARLAELRTELQRRWFRRRLVQLANLREGSASAGLADFPHAARLRQLLADDSATDFPSPPPKSESEEPNTELLTSDPTTVLLQMLQAEPDLFAASLYEPARIPELLEKRSSVLNEACDGREDLPFPTASAIALMLVASQPETRLLRSTSFNISRPLDDPRFNRLVAAGQHRDVLRKLVSAWILRPGIAADRPLVFAIQHRLPAGRDVAVRVLQGGGAGHSCTMPACALRHSTAPGTFPC